MNKIISLIFLFTINLFAGERIVTLSPSINEIVYALGEGDSVVANTMHCRYPKETRSVLKVGGYASISLEKILQVNPSVVIAQNYDEKLLDNLNALNLKTLVYKTNTLTSIKSTIGSLGDYLNQQKKANTLIKDIDNAFKALAGFIKDRKIMIVIHPVINLSKDIYIAGNNIYFNDIIKASGNVNVYQSKSTIQPVVNVEKIINMNPDIIVLLGSHYVEKQAEMDTIIRKWEKLPINAAINKNVYAVVKEYSGIPSHRVVNFMEDFKEILENVKSK